MWIKKPLILINLNSWDNMTRYNLQYVIKLKKKKKSLRMGTTYKQYRLLLNGKKKKLTQISLCVCLHVC